MSKEINHLILELTGDAVKPNTQTKWDSADSLVVPIMPPSLLGICKLIHISYILKVNFVLFAHNALFLYHLTFCELTQ